RATVSSRSSTARLEPSPVRGRSSAASASSTSRFERAFTPASASCRTAKVTGIAVNIGARVAAAAGPGEVFVSGTVKDLVAGSEIEFQDKGVRELKGVPGEWRLYAAA